ncbi:hypothetical protein NIASO_19165 [Niabella soli DSM 19437]|uniref:Uncharacterized protein n=2 Tax=Niabella TaxID=379899 RepID=W0F4N0_9BACT|nr:hypothetical protein NIASO_19165 [Niabella soli DSM 19437]
MRRAMSLIIVGTSLIFSCRSDSAKTTDEKQDAAIARRPDALKVDTAIFAVYNLSPHIIGIAIELNNFPPNTIDSAFNAIAFRDSAVLFTSQPDAVAPGLYKPCPDCIVVDTTGPYIIEKNKELEKAIRQKIPNGMYLYGTNGIKKFRYQDVLYAIDECMSNVVILTVAPQDTAGIGKPLLASYQQLPLHYNKNYQQIDKSIAQWLKTQPDDYPNMNYVPTKTFADLDSLYFTYTDNFTMTDGDRNNERMYFFPSRTIFKKVANDSLTVFWGAGLDLFGIPCD